jgi:NAD(P)-dependent dehydrogenase (short-subunit alcohol dehydrogenase family)
MMAAAALDGRVIAVTGAGSGIGRALARLLVQKGATVALADKDAVGLSETARLLGNYPHSMAVLDVSDDTAVHKWVDHVADEFGALDGIINNAGLSVVAPFADCPKADFDRVMNVNFEGVVSGCRHALPHLKKSNNAWLVNISSVFGMMGFPTQSAYNASKFAVRGLTEALYIELGETDPQIRVIRVHPGGIKTNVARNSKKIASMPGQTLALDADEQFEKAARTTPEQAAATIVAGMEKGRHRVLIGPDARIIDIVTRLLPVSYFRLMRALVRPG